MNIDDAISKACTDVGILPPKARAYGKWIKTDTLSGKNGKGDGRIIINDLNVTAWNWQTGETVTVDTRDPSRPNDRRQIQRQIQDQQEKRRQNAERAARIASRLIGAAKLSTHDYLVKKGFPDEQALTVNANIVRKEGGDYLVPDGCQQAIVIPARAARFVRSVQLIWENGDKKFLFGGEIAGASHRISTGRDTWHCEGFATALSLRCAFQGFGYSATILSCFSAANVAQVAKTSSGRAFIAADHDKPREQFDGVGAGEFYARKAGKYVMPPVEGDDFNDMQRRDGVFAVQRLLCNFLNDVRRGER